MENPSVNKKIFFRYLKGKMDYGLWYPKRKYFLLTTYIDLYWERYINDRKSTSGSAFS